MITLDITNAAPGGEPVLADAVNKAQAYNGLLYDAPLPFMELPARRFQFEEMRAVASSLKGRVKNLVVLGIGGSSLGTQTIMNALLDPFSGTTERPRCFMLDNIDPHTIRGVIDYIRPEAEKTALVVISKSGDTSETIAQFMIFRELLGQATDRIVLITDAQKGHLVEIARTEGYRTLVVPDGVGGRFSVLTPVGLLPALMLGVDIDALLAGAAAMRGHIASAPADGNMAVMLAALLYVADARGRNIHVMMPYCDRLAAFADWFRQLEAESLGKQGLGPTPLKCIGATDQHSQLQLFMEGPKDKFVLFLHAEDASLPIPAAFPFIEDLGYLAGKDLSALFRAEFLATTLALRNADVPNATLRLDTVDARSLGALFFLFEMVIPLMGNLYGVNAFDQPGVEQGKIYTKALMGKKGYEEEARRVNEKLGRSGRTITL
jgi:glucose-6-phosphate isomerase